MELDDKQLLDFVRNFAEDNAIKIPLDDAKIINEKEKIKYIARKWLMHCRESEYQMNHLMGYLESKCKKKIRKTKTK